MNLEHFCQGQGLSLKFYDQDLRKVSTHSLFTDSLFNTICFNKIIVIHITMDQF